MRKKEFIIFIIIFTILYIIFFLIYDKVSDNNGKKRLLKMAKSLINMDQYNKFACFYGIRPIAVEDLLIKIYFDYIDDKDCTISIAASSYNISNMEFVVIILYLEFLDLIPRRIISLNNDNIKKITFNDNNMIKKYNDYFKEKKSFDMIASGLGKMISDDLKYIDTYFLVPGVRIVDSVVYYVGDYL